MRVRIFIWQDSRNVYSTKPQIVSFINECLPNLVNFSTFGQALIVQFLKDFLSQMRKSEHNKFHSIVRGCMIVHNGSNWLRPITMSTKYVSIIFLIDILKRSVFWTFEALFCLDLQNLICSHSIYIIYHCRCCFPQAPFRVTNVPGIACAGIIQLRRAPMAPEVP